MTRKPRGPFDMPLVNGKNLYLNDGIDAGRKLWKEKREIEEADAKAAKKKPTAKKRRSQLSSDRIHRLQRAAK